MPFIEKPKDLYKYAVKNKFTMPAFHIFGIDTIKAVLEAAEEEDSPVIMQLFEYTYDVCTPFPAFFTYFKELCAESKAPVLLHHDHNGSVDGCKWAIDVGFPSIMFDGSHLPYEENVEKTKEVVDYAHERGVWVEAELGSIPGFEEAVISSATTEYTKPEKAAEFIEKTGCDSLAVSVGTAHGGVEGDAPLEIDFELLGKIRESVGEDYPIILHGAASLPKGYIDEVNKWGGKVEQLMMCTEETIKKATDYGIAKANMDVDNMLAFTAAVRKFLVEKPEEYNHLMYLMQAKQAFKDAVKHKMHNVTMSSGHGANFMKDYS